MHKNKQELYLRRICNAKMIDYWFFEEGNSRRSHESAYRTFILPLFGICRDTFSDYRLHYSDRITRLYAPPPYIEIPLWLPVIIVKSISTCEANKLFIWFKSTIENALKKAINERIDETLDADALIKSIRYEIMKETMDEQFEEKEPVEI